MYNIGASIIPALVNGTHMFFFCFVDMFYAIENLGEEIKKRCRKTLKQCPVN